LTFNQLLEKVVTKLIELAMRASYTGI